MGYHASDEDQRYYVLGLRDITTKSAADTLSTFKELLADLDQACEDSKSASGKKILMNIRNTMSDRASTELKWHELLKNYRSEVLPLLIDNWTALSDEEREPLEQLSSFFCGLHSLVQYAEVSEKAISAVEKELFDGKGSGAASKGLSFKSEGNGVLRLVKGASKAFARGGSDKAGVHGPFKTFCKPFLEESRMKTLPIIPFRGSRFNILFFNAGFIYFLRDQMITFLQKFGATNKLLKCVQADLDEPFYLAGCRALGLVSKIITSPLWRCLEDKAIHILDLPKIYDNIQVALHRGTQNPHEFMDGTINPFDVNFQDDVVFRALTEPADYDGQTETVLQNVLPSLAKVMTAHSQHLLDTAECERETSKSVAKHNKFSERVFAYMDQLMKCRPNSTTLVHEATIMFSLNKTDEWLGGMSEEQTRNIISEARKKARTVHKNFKRRADLILEQKQEALRKKEKEEKERADRKLHELEKYTKDIHFHGLWQSIREVDEMLTSIPPSSGKVNALKAQLRFRQHVLRQTHPNGDIYAFSAKGSPHSWEHLAENVKSLIAHSFSLPSTSMPEDAPLLVGKRIQHRFEADEFKGRVVSQVPGYPEWYNVKYDGDEAIYSYKLLDDYAEGDLKIVC
ncbi:uncharacterized protein [Diadema setosum]|uniref:uncharacterized protein n=1 Tax=Diadema setosum TaxID=31175 RepID=UPI003B3AC2CE